eukprot:COSAG05_NODE_2041_length_3650_cov_10.234582_4_plen_75_part_00
MHGAVSSELCANNGGLPLCLCLCANDGGLGRRPAMAEKSKKPKKKKPVICINLAHCGYPIVYRCARDMGWKVSS